MIINIGDRKIKINDEILSHLYDKRQININDYESGGMLIGSIIRGSNDIIIEDLTLPIKEDNRSRLNYVRSEKHNELLEQKWVNSQFTKMYFGEWHTHPQADPLPSSQDVRNWHNLMKESKTETELLIFIIAGIDVFKIWIGDRERLEIYQVYGGDYNGHRITS